MLPTVAIITPTYRRELKIIERCIASVKAQVYAGPILHFICSDDDIERPLFDYINHLNDPNIIYWVTGKNTNTYGAAARQAIIDQFIETDNLIEYVAFVDDDNIIFPHYISDHVAALEKSGAGFSICRILHLGPLSEQFSPPAILTGIPPRLTNIDTLQVMVRKHAMLDCGWTTFTGKQGYCNDGYTYERLAAKYRWVEVPELLGIHI